MSNLKIIRMPVTHVKTGLSIALTAYSDDGTPLKQKSFQLYTLQQCAGPLLFFFFQY